MLSMRTHTLIPTLILALALTLPAAASTPAMTGLGFEILRSNSPIGTHRVRFSRVDDRLIVDIAIDIEVKLAFVTVYRYTHRSRETWAADRLVALESTTSDNGERHWVKAEAREGALAVESSAGSLSAPADILPTSYWREETVRRQQMLDTMTGRLVTVTITPAGQKRVMLSGTPVEARVYRVSGDINSEIVYGPQGDWIGLNFEARGATIAYRPNAI